MSNCSYGPNGSIPKDASFISGLRSKNVIGCVAKFADVESNTALINDALKVKEVIDSANVLYYGAKGDGVTDDTAAIQAALNAGVCHVYFPAGVYVTTAQLTYTGNNLTLEGCNATISLNSSNAADRVLVLTGNNNAVKTLEFTSVNRQTHLLQIFGDENLVESSKFYFATKAGASGVPIYGTSALLISTGIRNIVTHCEMYNINGWGSIFETPTYTTFHQNYVHDNFAGIRPGSFSVITENIIADNNTSPGVEAGDGILTSVGVDSVTISNNKVSGNGEHGMYIRATQYTIEGNVVFDNHFSGIKIRDCNHTIIVGNTFRDNNVTLINVGELEIQASNVSDIEDVTVSGNTFQSRVGSPLMSIKCSYFVGGPTSINRLTISDNVGEGISGGFNADCVVSGNIMSSYIDIAVANADAPATMVRCVCSNNQTALLSGIRARETIYSGNIVTQIGDLGRSNKFIGNRITGQTMLSNLGYFTVFSDNYMYWNGAATGVIFTQNASASLNSDKIFCGNIFVNLQGTNLILFTSSPIAGNGRILFANNQGDSTANLLDVYGTNHRIIGNVNTGGGGVALIRETACFSSGNYPATTNLVNNPNLRQITGWNTTTTGANAASVVPSVISGAYVQAEVQAIANVLNAVKRDLILQGLLSA